MSIIKKLKVYRELPAEPTTYDIGASAQNIDYTDTTGQNSNVKDALDYLYNNGSSSSSSDVNKAYVDSKINEVNNSITALAEKIGFTSDFPTQGEGQTATIDKSSDLCYKDIIYSFVKVRIDSTTSRQLQVQGIATKKEDGSFEYNDKKTYNGEYGPIFFKWSSETDWKTLSNFCSTGQTINLTNSLQVKVRIKQPDNEQIAVFTSSGWKTIPSQAFSNNDYIELISDSWSIEQNKYHTFTFNYTFGTTLYNNITKIGTVLLDAETRNISQENSKFLNLIYPIGSIYMSVNGTPPNFLFGGIWQAIEGRFLLAQGIYDDNQFAPYGIGDKKGREDSVLVKHNHGVTAASGNISINTGSNGAHTHTRGSTWADDSASGTQTAFTKTGKHKRKTLYTGSDGAHTHTVTIAKTAIVSSFTINEVAASNIGNTSNTLATPGISNNIGNLPPYLVVYMWKRIA